MEKLSKENLEFVNSVLVWYAVNQHQIFEVDEMHEYSLFRQDVKKDLKQAQNLILKHQKKLCKNMGLDEGESLMVLTEKIESFVSDLKKELNVTINVD